jgi:hypothetical protein
MLQIYIQVQDPFSSIQKSSNFLKWRVGGNDWVVYWLGALPARCVAWDHLFLQDYYGYLIVIIYQRPVLKTSKKSGG